MRPSVTGSGSDANEAQIEDLSPAARSLAPGGQDAPTAGKSLDPATEQLIGGVDLRSEALGQAVLLEVGAAEQRGGILRSLGFAHESMIPPRTDFQVRPHW